MFNPDKALRDAIFAILKNDGKSISALSRELEEKGFSIHRLILTGYLRALTDMNVLREKEIPPAKVYVPVKGKDKDIYEVVGERARELCTGPEADLLILYTLNKLFHRPVFLDELKRCGTRDPPNAPQVSGDVKNEARKMLLKAKWKIQDTNPAYFVDDPAIQTQYEEMLTLIVTDLLDFSYLIMGTKQTKLAFEGAKR